MTEQLNKPGLVLDLFVEDPRRHIVGAGVLTNVRSQISLQVRMAQRSASNSTCTMSAAFTPSVWIFSTVSTPSCVTPEYPGR